MLKIKSTDQSKIRSWVRILPSPRVDDSYANCYRGSALCLAAQYVLVYTIYIAGLPKMLEMKDTEKSKI